MRFSGSSTSFWPSGRSSVVGFGDLRQQAADAHVQPRVVQDGCQARDVHQVELVARVVLRHQQEVPRLGTDLLDGRHGGLHAQRQEGRVQVVEAAGEQVGIDGRQLETGIAQVDRGIKRRRVLQPLRAQPALDRGVVVEDAPFEVEQRAGQCGSEVWNHEFCCLDTPFAVVPGDLTPGP
jgi:hypothetical protein